MHLQRSDMDLIYERAWLNVFGTGYTQKRQAWRRKKGVVSHTEPLVRHASSGPRNNTRKGLTNENQRTHSACLFASIQTASAHHWPLLTFARRSQSLDQQFAKTEPFRRVTRAYILRPVLTHYLFVYIPLDPQFRSSRKSDSIFCLVVVE